MPEDDLLERCHVGQVQQEPDCFIVRENSLYITSKHERAGGV